MKIYNLCMNAFKVLLGIIILYLFIASISITCKTYQGQFIAYCDDSSKMNLFLIGLFILIIFGLRKIKFKYPADLNRSIKWIIIGFSFVMSIFVLSTQYIPGDDPSVVLGCARAINMGNFKHWFEGGIVFTILIRRESFFFCG